MQELKISIVFCLYKNLLWVIWNLKIILQTNSNTFIDFIVIDNDLKLKKYLNYLILKLLLLKVAGNRVSIKHVFMQKKVWGGKQGSQDHGAALDKASKYIFTEYVVILDPDCVVISDDWIKKIGCTLKNDNLDFIGFPQARSINNIHLQSGLGEYKYKTPLAFFLAGKTESIFTYSFMPNHLTGNILDVGYRLSEACLTNKFKYGLAESFNTRDHTCEISFVNDFICTFHKMSELGPGVVGLHFGKGSNPTSKRSSEHSLFAGVIISLYKPFKFRKLVYNNLRK